MVTLQSCGEEHLMNGIFFSLQHRNSTTFFLGKFLSSVSSSTSVKCNRILRSTLQPFQHLGHHLPTQFGDWITMTLWGNWRKVCVIGIMKWGAQRADGATGREETHHQATPSCNIHVHLRSSEKFLPWRSQSQTTNKNTTYKLQSHIVLNSSFQLKPVGYPRRVAHPWENGLFFRE